MAINSKSKLRDILADDRAVKILTDNGCDLVSNADQMGPCMGMKIDMLLKFPQTGLSKDQVKTIVEALDALDA